MRQSRLVWQWTMEEQRGLERLLALIKGEIERIGLGRVAIDDNARPSPRAHHHAGTLRMHEEPQQGVVNAQGRVHGIENLFCVGAAVFPTAGFANPMLTVLALALRLADHLAPVKRKENCRQSMDSEGQRKR